MVIRRTYPHATSSNHHNFLCLMLLFLIRGCFFIVVLWNSAAIVAQPSNALLNNFSTSKPLGCTLGAQETTFRLFAPRATAVSIVFFTKHNDTKGREISMLNNGDGTWEYTEQQTATRLVGTYYAYRVTGNAGKGETFDATALIADPYSKAVATQNTFRHTARTLILDPKYDTEYDWQGDSWVVQPNHNRLVIYEAHVRDMTAHTGSGIAAKGTYKGLTEPGKKGGLSYLKSLGVNAVEFLPVQEFGNLEPPLGDSSTIRTYATFNGSNVYEQNHWGYMTSFFFAPESYYATGGSLKKGAWSGAGGHAVREFKDLVKTLHHEKIAVIMDVVYNHVSDFDQNSLKVIDKFYYFRTDSNGAYINTSYCGNDFKSERPMARRLIVESVKYWMREYHVDGFRFDLAAMLDRETCEEIAREARAINPNVVLIAEPWGGNKYSPALFSELSWASWNDRIRNGVKGQNPHNGLGFIFGKHQGDNTHRTEQAFITGTLREDGGLFQKKEHSVNYLESHDDETMGDFIRVGLGDCNEQTVIKNIDSHAKLTPKQLALHKLAALFLFTAQGPTMIHAGQEYARSKVIAGAKMTTNAKIAVRDTNTGKIDRNSYNKDNATNYINYAHAEANSDLVAYYQGLIALKKQYPDAFGSADKSAIEFLDTADDAAIAFRIRPTAANVGGSTQAPKSFIVLLNGNTDKPLQIKLPQSPSQTALWRVLANGERVSPVGELGNIAGQVRVSPSSGMIVAE
jgi:pullulanase